MWPTVIQSPGGHTAEGRWSRSRPPSPPPAGCRRWHRLSGHSDRTTWPELDISVFWAPSGAPMAERQCRHCQERFPDLAALNAHKRAVHMGAAPRTTKAMRLCPVCREPVPAAGYVQHLRNHRPETGPRHSHAWQRLRREKLKAAGGRCQRCGRSIGVKPRDWQLHHLIGEKQGGPPTSANTIAVCSGCHTALHSG